MQKVKIIINKKANGNSSRNIMITEDYVSFETAKLLKEKGFDGQRNKCHMSIGKNEQREVLAKGTDWDDSFILCPTLQMAMKWLREVHNIHIEAVRYPAKVKNSNDEYCKPWWPEITMLKSLDEADEEFDLGDEYDTYEEACKAAIKYCLENLI